jgi:hypothetical protein
MVLVKILAVWYCVLGASLSAEGSRETERLPRRAMSGLEELRPFLEAKLWVFWKSRLGSGSGGTVARLR